MLPLRPHPKDDETIAGYFVRLAERNGRDDVMACSRSLGMPFASMSTALVRRFDLGPLSAATGLSVDRFAPMTAWPTERGRMSFRGQDLPRRLLALRHRRACPECLVVSGHHRAAWDVEVIGACPIHACMLLESCPSCGVRLGWTCSSLRMCSCGFDLGRTRTAPLADHELGGSREVLRLLGLPIGVGDTGHRPVPHEVAALGADAAIRLMSRLGQFEVERGGRSRQPGNPRSRSHRYAGLDTGYRMALAWPRSFQNHLDGVRQRSSSQPGRYGFRKEFGSVAAWATTLPTPDPIRRFVLDEVEKHCASKPAICSRTPALVRPTATSQALVLNVAAAHLGVAQGKAREALSRRGLVLRADGLGRGAPIVVDRTGVEALASELGGMLDKRGLARVLGCGRKALDALLSTGALVPRTTTADLARGRVWPVSEAMALVRGLERSDTLRPGTAGLDFLGAFRSMRQAGVGPSAAMRMLLRDVSPIATDRGTTGLARILFRADDVRDLASTGRGASDLVSVPEFAAHSGLKQELTYRLCTSGVIRTTQGSRGALIHPSEIDRFRRDYVLPGALTQGQGHRKGWMAERLIAAGLMPVSGPSIDGGRHWVFRRHEVETWLGSQRHMGIANP